MQCFVEESAGTNLQRIIVPSPRNTLALSRNRVKKEPAIIYSPRGDFKSPVKMHGGQIKIYLRRQSDQILEFLILLAFSYLSSPLCF